MASINDMSSITDTLAFKDDDGGDDGLLGAEEAVVAPLFGRIQDQKLLLGAYQSLVATRKSHVVFLHGSSGSGKTALVDATLRAKVGEEGQGYFCAGKFFQNSGVQEPYSAIMTAFSDLCDLIVQSENFDEQRREKIQKGLLSRPEEAAMLGRMINLTPFLEEHQLTRLLHGVRNNSGESSAKDVTFAKFKSACKTFLCTMSSSPENHPVVLFIDDIQWMDEGSRQLIEMFVNDDELTNVMLILAYRDEEAGKISEFLSLKEGREGSIDIQLNNLEYAGVYEMVCGFLGSSEARFQELTDLLMTKTQGHPFFALQFLHAIVGEHLLIKDEDGSWKFEVQEIQREIMVADTLADLLHRKIEQLSSDMKTTLTVASLFGYWFDGDMLAQVASQVIEKEHCDDDTYTTGSSEEMTQICLAEAVTAGFVERLGEGSYQFSHDKLQAAFLEFVDDVQREHLHSQIGGAFLAQQEEGGDASTAFNAAVHLNEAIGCLHSSAQRVALARLNLKAAQYCTEMIAFDKACDLLCTGLELLDPITKWSADMFDLTFEMTEELARMELSAGRFDACKEHVEEVLRHAKSTEMKINALLLGVGCRMASNDVHESLLAAKHALRILNVVKMPKKVSLIRHVLPKLFSVKRKMSRMTDDDILGLPVMQDRSVATATRLLGDLLLYCLARDDDDQAAYAALLAMELTLQYGLSPYSSTALAIFGITELQFGNYDQAYRYGKLAMKLMHESNGGEGECSTVVLATTTLLHWKEPLSELKGPLYQAARHGLERGDFVYGAFCFWQYTVMDTYLGKSLDAVAESYTFQYRRSCALGGASAFQHWIQPGAQFVANLQSESVDWEQLTTLTGEFMQEDTYVQEAKETNHTMLYTAALWSKAQLACFFGMYDLAEAKYNQIAGMGTAIHLSFASVAWYEFAAIIHYEQYKRSGKRARLRKARRCKQKLLRMKSLGSPNTATSLRLIEVKEISVRKDVDEIELAAAFDSAITALSGTVYFEAIANEDAGFTFARLGLGARAEKYFQRALHIYYYDWRSTAKYNWLQEKIILEGHTLGFEEQDCGQPNDLVGDVIVFDGNDIRSDS